MPAIRILALGTALMAVMLGWSACSSNRSSDSAPPVRGDLLDNLTTFVQLIQEDRFDKAMQCLTPEERSRFDAAGGVGSPALQRRLKALRLSTLARRPTVRLAGKGLEGIYDELPRLSADDSPPPPSPLQEMNSPMPEEAPADMP
jgi:hypothetical protein